MNGYTGGTASVSSNNSAPSSQSEYVPMDVTSAFSNYLAAKQVEATDANIDKTKAEAKSIELQNRAVEAAQKAWFDSTTDSYFTDSDGGQHRPTDKDFNSWANDYFKQHGELPELTKKAGVYSAEAAAVPSAIANFKAQIAQSGMYEAQSNLAKQVSELKLGDRNVMNALYRMDEAQYNQLLSVESKSISSVRRR